MRRLRQRMLNHKLKIAIQDKINCPMTILWSGCGNLQPVPVDSAAVPSGDFAGEQIKESSNFVSVPNNEITIRAMTRPGRYIIDCDPCSITYKKVFALVDRPTQNTKFGDYIIAQVDDVNCPSCEEDLFQWCATSSECRNGVIVTYTATIALTTTLIDFINQQSWGTTILLPDGTYDGGDITVDYVIIKKEDEADVIVLNTPLVDTTSTQQVIQDLN